MFYVIMTSHVAVSLIELTKIIFRVGEAVIYFLISRVLIPCCPVAVFYLREIPRMILASVLSFSSNTILPGA